MDIEGRIRDLGSVDSGPLSDRILAQDEEAWLEEQYRQNAFEVHKDTASMVVLFLNESSWPEVIVDRRPGWDRLADVAVPLMDSIIESHYQPVGTIIRAMAARLRAGGRITPHVDRHPSFHLGHRIHVPITTNSRVRFTVEGRPIPLEVGQAFEINNQKQHSVTNKGREDRISFIFDYIPPGKKPATEALQ
ncbi:MAG: aspartyl/asparaginyl beta-hydroxylase domain-containing protein [Pseudomonadota bacterium]